MLTVRPMRLQDVPAVTLLEQTAPDPWNAAQLKEELETSAALCLVACENGEEEIPLAFCTVQIAACEATLNAITVQPACRGRGLGAFLLNALQTQLQARGVCELYLEVRTQNTAALALYQKCGFVRTGLRPRFYKNPPDDAITMKKEWLL